MASAKIEGPMLACSLQLLANIGVRACALQVAQGGSVEGIEARPVRAGGQIDMRPIPTVAAARAVAAIKQNASLKKGASQRDKEKAAKAAPKAAAPKPAAAAEALTLTKEEAQARLWARLKEMGYEPRKEEDPNLEAERPTGHSTHNLFLKDKKKKKLFMVCLRQDRRLNLKDLTAMLGMKQLRMTRLDGNPTGITSGCVTLMSLFNDTAAAITPVMDKALMEMDTLTICAGCDDPRDHSQHNVVDIKPADILTLLAESGHPEPVMLELDAEEEA